MPDVSESIHAIRDAVKYAAEDPFSYMTVLEYHVTTPAVLPALGEVLTEHPDLTSEIGWDLVKILLPIDGSESCLETVARLGNPREVLITVMEALEALAVVEADAAEEEEEGGNDDDDDDNKDEKGQTAPTSAVKTTSRFIILLGMLAILHQRLKTRSPSSFLGPSLARVFDAYAHFPTLEKTAAVINLARALSGRKRPPLPSRGSSVNVLDPAETPVGAARADDAPDPEADGSGGQGEESMQRRLLQAFVIAVLQRFADEHEMLWSPRLMEHYHPERNVPGRRTTMERFREEEELARRDGVVGTLVALLRDLGLTTCDPTFISNILSSPSNQEEEEQDGAPLARFADADYTSPSDIRLPPGGAVCLLAYWLFSAAVFGADSPVPDSVHVYPDHLALLMSFLGGVTYPAAAANITSAPGTADALLSVGIALDRRDLLIPASASSSSPAAAEAAAEAKAEAAAGSTAGPDHEIGVLAYHGALMQFACLHPATLVRAAATAYAGAVLHGEPDEGMRLAILEDLFENSGGESGEGQLQQHSAALRACAVGWLREEIMGATTAADKKPSTSSPSSSSVFASPDLLAWDSMGRHVFPDLRTALPEGGETTAAEEYWDANHGFLLQVASLAYLLFPTSALRGETTEEDQGSTEAAAAAAGEAGNKKKARFDSLVTPALAGSVKARFVEPLMGMSERLLAAEQQQKGMAEGGGGGLLLEVLVDRLKSLGLD